MKYLFGIKIGGLQHKIFTLMIIFMLALIAVFVAVSMFQQNSLTGVVTQATEDQQQSITDISEGTMRQVLSSSMTKSTALQAYIADDLFNDVREDVLTLQTFAKELYLRKNDFPNHSYAPPDPSKNGKPTVQLLHEEGMNPDDSYSLGLLANMSEVMLSMYVNSDQLSSCFVATADGCILFANDRSGAYVDENGVVCETFAVRSRPWYKQAEAKGKLIFTGVELDAFTDIPGLVCAAPIYIDGEMVAVVGADVFLTDMDDYIQRSTNYGGFLFVVNEKGHVLFSSQTEGSFKPDLAENAQDLRESENTALAQFVTAALSEKTDLALIEADGKEYYMTGAPLPSVGWAAVSVMDKAITHQPTEQMLRGYEEINGRALDVYTESAGRSAQTFLIVTGILILLATAASLILAGRVVKPLEHMTKRINSLTGEDAVFEMEKAYKTGDEIEILAESFASLSTKTREYIKQITEITAEKERIGTELALATRIQADMLPNIYPAFPDRNEFDIYATMDPAREVGGDFYDFFLVDDDHLCMLIADVSGKGIPAALFMMASRIILASNAKLGKSPAEILVSTNDTICQNNREEMFVTVWLGILEISTGRLTAANAGHEYPVLMQPDGRFEIVKDKHGFVIGGMSGMKYKEYELDLKPGARLFLYTDGVPEATNADKELFGTDRMLAALNGEPDAAPDRMLKNVRRAVDDFVRDAEQFDDLTMLGFEYKGTTPKQNDPGKPESEEKGDASI